MIRPTPSKINHSDHMFEMRSYNTLIFIYSICYGIALSSLPVDAFVDRDNYLVYASSSHEIASYYMRQGLWSVFFNEPVWLAVNVLIATILSPEDVLRTTILFSSSVTAFLVLRNNQRDFIFLVLILLLPQVLKNNIIHLRQGFAIAVFLCGWFSGRQNIRYALFLLACLIHSSFFLIAFLIILNHFLVRFRMGYEIRAAIVFSGGVFVGFLGLWVAGLLGARQAAEYVGDSAAVSGLGFLFWSIVAVLFCLQGRRFLRENSLQFSIIVFYLSTYFLLPVTARVFESGILLVLLSLLGLTSYRKHFFIVLFGMYFLFQWVPRLALPWLGWGVENYI